MCIISNFMNPKGEKNWVKIGKPIIKSVRTM